MADRTSTPRSSDPAAARPTVVVTTADNGPTPGRETNPVSSLLRRLQDHAPHSTQLVGIMAFVVTGTVLLLLTGITVTVTFVGLIFFAPLIIVSSPIWFPVAAVFFFVAAGFLLLSGFGLATVAALSWIYKYFNGMRPPGSGRVDNARSRIYDTASHVKDYAREYGGYLKSKVKDAAPGA